MLYVILSLMFCALTNAGFNVPKLISVYNMDLYKRVLSKDLCESQMSYIIMNNTYLLSRFMDASARVPRELLAENFVDLGNYYQCLNINEPYKDGKVEGKYCVIQVPIYHEQGLSVFPHLTKMFASYALKGPVAPVSKWLLDKYTILVEDHQKYITEYSTFTTNPRNYLEFQFSICIPRVCTVRQTIDTLFFNVLPIGFHYKETYCRLPNDKSWGIADDVAVCFFSIITFVTLLSTIYEVIYIFVLKRDEKSVNVYKRSFSLYNNTRLLLHFPHNPDILRCLDGIKVVSLISIICLKALTPSFTLNYKNMTVYSKWLISAKGTVLTIAEIYVDTFFVITGILLVYLSANKMDSMSLLRNLHIFYLSKLLRILPLLATAIIFNASIFHKIFDGPMWNDVAMNAQLCKDFWWSTLLQYQNYLEPFEMCLPHSWYVAVDMQLHIISPILLFWLLSGGRKYARVAIVTTLGAALSASAFYNISNNCPASFFQKKRLSEWYTFKTKYYIKTMPRIAPFLVGMIVGYVLHLWRRKNITISKMLVSSLWLMTLSVISLTVYIYCLLKLGIWESYENILNTLVRPAWAGAVGWMVIACVHGYGGPINWILSLDMWRLPGRLTYGMYLFFYPIAEIIESTRLNQIYFKEGYSMYGLMSLLMTCFIFSFIITVLIEIPFKIWIKFLLERSTQYEIADPSRRMRLDRYEVYELAESKDED